MYHGSHWTAGYCEWHASCVISNDELAECPLPDVVCTD